MKYAHLEPPAHNPSRATPWQAEVRRLPSRFGSKLGGPVLPLRVQCLDQVRDVLARARGEQAAGREERGTLDGFSSAERPASW